MIPPNGFAKPDRVIKTYSFGGKKELTITQEVGDNGTVWSATKTTESGKTLYLNFFGQWTEQILLQKLFSSEKALISLLKKA